MVDDHATIPSPPLSSRDLRHAHTRAQHEFKLPGLRLEPQSTTWESSDVAIAPSAGLSECRSLRSKTVMFFCKAIILNVH